MAIPKTYAYIDPSGVKRNSDNTEFIPEKITTPAMPTATTPYDTPITPQDAAAAAFGKVTKKEAPAPTPSSSPTPTPTQNIANKQATIWDKASGKKAVINLDANGNAIKDDLFNKSVATVGNNWSLFNGAGGNKTTDANGNIINSQNAAAMALGGGKTQESELPELTPTGEEKKTDEKFTTPAINDILKGMNITPLAKSDYTESYNKLTESKTLQLDDLATQYEEEKIAQEQKNKQATAALQARLIKAGVSLDGTSFESAVAGQEIRNQEELNKLDRTYKLAKNKVEQDYNTNYLNLSKQEREEAFNVNVANINNIFKAQELSTDIWKAFSERDMSQKKLEADAAKQLQDMQLGWAKLSEDERATNVNLLEDFAKQGLYDVYDDATVKMLRNMEQKNGLEEGTLTGAATGGYWNRMQDLSLKAAQTESAKAQAKESTELLSLKKEKLQADIANVRSEIAKRSSGDGSGLSADQKAYYKDIEDGLKKLNAGQAWGEVWNSIATKYNIDSKQYDSNPQQAAAIDQLDSLLNKSFWSNPGAYVRNQQNLGKDKQNNFTFVIPGADGN